MTTLSGYGASSSDLAELLTQMYQRPFTEHINNDNTLLKRFSKKSGKDKAHYWKVHYGKNTSAASIAETDEWMSAGKQEYVAANSPFRIVAITYGATDFIQQASAGQGGYMAALTSEAEGANKDLEDAINTMVLADSNSLTTDIDGIGTIVTDTGTYAGIDRSTYTFWKSYVTANSGTARPLTIALMQDQLAELTTPDRKAKVSAILTSRKQYNNYGNIFWDNRRWAGEMNDPLDAGAKVLEYEGLPVVPVPSLSTDRMYFLDESQWFYITLQNYKTKPRPVDGPQDGFAISVMAQLVCEDTGKQGLIKDLG